MGEPLSVVPPPLHRRKSSLLTVAEMKKSKTAKLLVAKEQKRNLASLSLDPKKRLKSKKIKNLSRNGFEIHTRKRYRLDDGRIGICMFKGRTDFGKSSEDWVGLKVEVGEGEHDGSVRGKYYFRCRMGKGLFVRPYDIVEDMGSQNKALSKYDEKFAKEQIKRRKRQSGKGIVTSTQITEEESKETGYVVDDGHDLFGSKLMHSKTLINKNKGKRAQRKKHHLEV